MSFPYKLASEKKANPYPSGFLLISQNQNTGGPQMKLFKTRSSVAFSRLLTVAHSPFIRGH